MTEQELSAMTVMQLRKLAKEQQITLGAGLDKAGIIRKILESGSDAPAADSPAEESAGSEPRFQAAWHNSESPRFNARPAYQAPGAAPSGVCLRAQGFCSCISRPSARAPFRRHADLYPPDFCELLPRVCFFPACGDVHAPSRTGSRHERPHPGGAARFRQL